MSLLEKYNFSWIDDRVAGMADPDANQKVLQALRKEEVSAIVSLTKKRIPKKLVSKFEFSYLHLFIPDFSAPTAKHFDKFLAFLNKEATEEKVVVHCKAGKGRTGTILAVYLVSKGYSGKEAIQKIRTLRRGSIETYAQEQAVLAYARTFNRKETISS